MTKLFHIIMLVFIFGSDLAAQKKYTEEVAAIQFLLDSIRPKSRVLQDKIFCYDGEVWEDSYWSMSGITPDYRDLRKIGRVEHLAEIEAQQKEQRANNGFVKVYLDQKPKGRLRVCQWKAIKKMTDRKFNEKLEKDTTYASLDIVSSIKYDSTINSETLVYIEIHGVDYRYPVKDYSAVVLGLYGIVIKNGNVIYWQKRERELNF